MVDGIFAIAMTILVLGITPPEPGISQAQTGTGRPDRRYSSGNLYFYYLISHSRRFLVKSSPSVPFRPGY